MNIEEHVSAIESEKINTSKAAPDIALPLNTTFLPPRTSKFKKCLNPEVHNQVKLQNGPYPIALRKPAFVTELIITSDSASKAFSSLSADYKTLSGETRKLQKSHHEDGILFTINDFAKEIIIRYDKSLISTRLEITGAFIYGWGAEQLDSLTKEISAFEKAYNSFNTQKNKTTSEILEIYEEATQKKDKAEERLAQIENEIVEKNEEKSILKQEIIYFSSELEETKNELDEKARSKSSTDNYLEMAEKKLSGLNQDIEEKDSRVTDLNKNISNLKQELERLENNKNLFAESFEEYSNQGASYANTYLWISLLPITVITLIAIYLLNSGEDIWKLSHEIKTIGIKDLLLSKLPFTLLCLAVIQSMYSIAHTFILKSIAIGRDRLQLSKSQLLAREAHDSIVSELDLPKDVKYNYLISLRMQMLKAHLSKNIDDYSHDPDANLDPELRTWYSSLKDYLKGKISRSELEKGDDTNQAQKDSTH